MIGNSKNILLLFFALTLSITTLVITPNQTCRSSITTNKEAFFTPVTDTNVQTTQIAVFTRYSCWIFP
ncbi:MAG: hypothetical protein NTX05_00500, partial [Fusobacteria bacterium]|nr:hypothetical protein [Fusobacteriota bacterium]